MSAVQKKLLAETFLYAIEDDELTCIICEDFFTDAVTLICSHSYCKKCIECWSRSSSLCPFCLQETNGVKVSNRFINNIVSLRNQILLNTNEQIIPKLTTPNKITKIYSLEELTTFAQLSNPVIEDESDLRNQIEIPFLKEEELNKLPQYLINGVHLYEINEVIKEFNYAFKKKYEKVGDSKKFVKEIEMIEELMFGHCAEKIDKMVTVLIILEETRITSIKVNDSRCYIPKYDNYTEM